MSGTFLYRSCTSSVSLRNIFGYISAIQECIQYPTRASPLSNAPIVFSILSAYWLTLYYLLSRPGGSRASFSHSALFTHVSAFHNALLSLFSLIMFCGISKALFETSVTSSGGIRETVCTPLGTRMPSSIQYWIYIFYLSKFFELLDTVILLLRGRSLTLLHVWHHSSVIFEVRGWLEYDMVIGAYGMLFNTFVHIAMYAYYASCFMGKPLPCKRAITLTQIVQFLTGFTSVLPYMYYNSQYGCAGIQGLAVSAVLNGSYLLLFLRFYYLTYVDAKKNKSAVKNA